MKLRLVFVPPGGGEADYSLDFDSPAVPVKGDYITITRKDQDGTENFIVKRTWWSFSVGANGEGGRNDGVYVECEFAKGPLSSTSHKKSVEIYGTQTGTTLEFDESMY